MMHLKTTDLSHFHITYKGIFGNGQLTIANVLPTLNISLSSSAVANIPQLLKKDAMYNSRTYEYRSLSARVLAIP